MCTGIQTFWIVNDTRNRLDYTEFQNITGLDAANGSILIVTQSANNTLYGCSVFNGSFFFDTGILYVAGKYVYTTAYGQE